MSKDDTELGYNGGPDVNKSESVIDEEGTVDRKIKQRILSNRELVDRREDMLFTLPIVDPNYSFNRAEAVQAWAGTVKQFLRTIEPLLRSSEVDKSEYYYYEVPLGGETLVPPDTPEYQFSKFGNPEMSNSKLMRQMGLPPNFSPPEPEPVPFEGLLKVIETDVLHHTWTVQLNNAEAVPNHEYRELSVEQPIPKEVLENAVRAADNFLQDAGIGLEIATENKAWEV